VHITQVEVFLIGVPEQLVSEGLLWEGDPVLINVEVYIVAPFGPPGGAYEEFAIGKASEIGLQHERVLHLSQG